MPSEKPTSRCSENRRCNKPIMEKRRRARINSCLNDLKALILEALKKDPARHSKLEKADILEMTVRHLQNLQRQQSALAAAANPHVTNKFRAGFSECAAEVSRFVGGHADAMDGAVRQRLLGHLANCTNRLSAVQSLQVMQQQPFGPTADDSMDTDASIAANHSNSVPALFRGLQLLPTRLPNGDLALLLPANYSIPATVTAPPCGLNANHSPPPQQRSCVTTPDVSPVSPATPHHGDFQQHPAPASPHYSSSSSCSSGTTSPSPPPPTALYPVNAASPDLLLVKREPLVSAAMVERFRSECRTGSRHQMAPWVQQRVDHQTAEDSLNGRVVSRESSYKEDSETEPWRPW